MGIFDMFTTQREKTRLTLLKSKEDPSFVLMHTSLAEPGKVYSFGPSFSNKLKQMTVFATNDEKTAILYALQPMYYFTFGNNEKCAIITGDDHSLLKLDNITAYIYVVDSNNFEPIVTEHGEFYNEWISKSDVHIREDKLVKKITFKDILKSGIQVFWIKDKNIVIEFDKQIRSSGFNNGNQILDFLKDQSNWYPDKVVYMNAYKKEGLAYQTEKGWDVPKQQVILEEIPANINTQVNNIKQSNTINANNTNKFPNQSVYQNVSLPNYNNNQSNINKNPQQPTYVSIPDYNNSKNNNGVMTYPQNSGYQNQSYDDTKSYQRRKAS